MDKAQLHYKAPKTVSKYTITFQKYYKNHATKTYLNKTNKAGHTSTKESKIGSHKSHITDTVFNESHIFKRNYKNQLLFYQGIKQDH